MADTKITALTALTAADPANDVIPIVDVSDTSMAASGTTKKISVNNILGASGTATLASATITGAATVGTTLGVTGASTLTGNVGVGMSPVVLFNVGGTGGNDGDLYFNTLIRNTGTAATSQPRTGILFSCYSTGTSSFTNFAGITGGKENVTNANTAGFLSLCTSSNGGSPTERARFNSTGAFVLAGGTTTANGIGIAFPTTQSASSDANCLDDYEEGTWTGTLKGSVSDPTIAVTATGAYTKVGRLVTVTIGYSNVLTTGASGNVTITGLPFSGAASSAGSVITFDMFTTSTTLACWNTGTSIAFYVSGGFIPATHNAGASRSVTVTITYYV